MKSLSPTLMTSIGFLLAKAAQKVASSCETELATLGLTPRQVGLLRAISEHGPVSQGALGELLRIDRTTMVTLADELESTGLVCRERSPTDRRSYQLSLSQKGISKLQRGWTVIERAEAQELTRLTPKEQIQLRKLLHKLMEGVPT